MIAIEGGIAVALVVVTAAGVTRPTWLLVAGLAGYRSRTYGHTATLVPSRWWPPYCLVIDFVAAAILVVLLAIGVDFH